MQDGEMSKKISRHGDMEIIYKILVGTSEGNIIFRPKLRWE